MFHLVFLRYRYENERLPPTYAASYQKNFRNKLYSDAVKTCPSCKKKTLGRPSQYGWVWNNKNRVYDPMMTEPESIAELSIVNAIPVA